MNLDNDWELTEYYLYLIFSCDFFRNKFMLAEYLKVEIACNSMLVMFNKATKFHDADNS